MKEIYFGGQLKKFEKRKTYIDNLNKKRFSFSEKINVVVFDTNKMKFKNVSIDIKNYVFEINIFTALFCNLTNIKFYCLEYELIKIGG